jgi:hexosaminidase
MMATKKALMISAALAAALCLAVAPTRAGCPLKLLPTPKSIKVAGGEMPLTAQSRIVVLDAKLKPIAEIFSRELLAMTAIKLEVVDAGPGKPGDIVLNINPAIRADQDITALQNRKVVKTRDMAHTISVTDKALVEGFDYRAVCEGTSTLLQALICKDGQAALPKMEIKDWPFADYVGYMFDVARQDVPIHAIKDFVIAMRFWKVRHLHLHLSDESAMMFPFRKYPEASKFNGAINNGDPGKVWDREELIRLVAFADARGVTLVPELETPGHCGGYQAALGDKLGDCNYRMMDIAKDSIYPHLEEMINDMCEVFKSSPYFHIGGDEIELDRLKGAPHVKEYLKAHNMREPDKGGMDDLLKQHVLRLNEFVKKNGKKTIYWGGYQGPPQDPAMTDCIVYSWYKGAREAQDAGFTTITVPWDIVVPWENWNIFSSNHDALKRTDSVLGGARVAWEQGAESLVNTSMYEGFLQEGKWAVDSTATAVRAEVDARDRACAVQLRKVAAPVEIKASGKIGPAPAGFDGFEYEGELNVSLIANLPASCTIHYTSDGTEPTPKSTKYDKPLTFTGSLRLRAAMFDKDGQLVGGITFAPKYRWKGFEQNLTTGKPVTTSGPVNKDEKPELANDGWVDIGKYWGTIPAPQWWQVDLGKEYELGSVRVFPYWDGIRYYQYTVSVGPDPEHLTQVVDATKNTTPETDQGHMHQFPPTKARYIRINVLKNSENTAVHLVEVRAYEAPKSVPLAVPPAR